MAVKIVNQGTGGGGGGGGGGLIVDSHHDAATIAAADYPAGTLIYQRDSTDRVINVWAVPTSSE